MKLTYAPFEPFEINTGQMTVLETGNFDVYQKLIMNFDFINDLEIDFNESVSNISDDDMWQDEFYLEASTSNSTIIRDEIYPIIESVLSTPEGNKLFGKEVEAYMRLKRGLYLQK